MGVERGVREMRVVFDGLTTLLQDSASLPACYQAALARLGFDASESRQMAKDLSLLESLRRSSGVLDRSELIREYLAERGFFPAAHEIASALSAFTDAWISTVEPTPGARGCLEGLKRMGASIGVLFIGVEGTGREASEVLRSTGLLGLIDTAVYAGREGWLNSLKRLIKTMLGGPPDFFVTGAVERALASEQVGVTPILLVGRECPVRVMRVSGFGELLSLLKKISSSR
ncbi:MAG TPA: hypothetical protein ENG69_01070 [Candidatus Korarchaeota archaeon]|nr:hypothetical protein [Candidatus Korarchaeota archaeon]